MIKKDGEKKTFRLQKEAIKCLNDAQEKENAIRVMAGQSLMSQTELLEKMIISYYSHTYQKDLIADAKNREREFMTNIIDGLLKTYFNSLTKQILNNREYLEIIAAFFNISVLFENSKEHRDRIFKALYNRHILDTIWLNYQESIEEKEDYD